MAAAAKAPAPAFAGAKKPVAGGAAGVVSYAASASASATAPAAALASATEFGSADYIIKVVVIGDSGVGKSCLLKRFASGNYLSDFYTTIGVDLEIRTVNLNGKLAKLQIWDTAGQERFRTITTSYYRGANAIMLTYDVTCAASFAAIPQWLREVSRYANEDARVLLVGNKTDLPAHRVVSTADGAKLAAELGLRFIETSAKDAVNVEAAFTTMAQDYVDTQFAALKGKGGAAKGSSPSALDGASIVDPDAESPARCTTSICPACTIL